MPTCTPQLSVRPPGSVIRKGPQPDADRRLIQRVLTGDPGAREEFVARYDRLLYYILRRSHIPPQDWEDIYQEFYARLWARDMRRLRHWQSLGMRKFSIYLAPIVSHLIYDHQRKMGKTTTRAFREGSSGMARRLREPIGGSPNTEMDVDAYLVQQERKQALHQALRRMRPRDIELISRLYFANQTYQEIAQALNMTVDNVGVTLAHARKRLYRQLCARYPDLFEEERSRSYSRR